VWSKLFDRQNPVGLEIRLNSQRFTVVGALAAKGESWYSPDDKIFVPLTTAQERLFGTDSLTRILAQMREADDFGEALFDIETLLRRSHRLRADAENDFRVWRQGSYLAAIQDTNREITRLIVLVALVSLLVGALGIANIMLVSVTERTREIGIRRSLGATRSHVLIQFLTEAVVLGTAGGILGVIGGGVFNHFYIGEDAVLMWNWVGYSFVICAGIGAVSGIYPAVRAAHLDVIDALRYE
jgi:putative ABC transport system permease protein